MPAINCEESRGICERSDIAPVDLVGEAFDEVGDFLQMRIEVERAAKRLERALLLAQLLHDHAEAGDRPEVTWLARQHLANVGQRLSVVLLQEMNGCAPVPGFC